MKNSRLTSLKLTSLILGLTASIAVCAQTQTQKKIKNPQQVQTPQSENTDSSAPVSRYEFEALKKQVAKKRNLTDLIGDSRYIALGSPLEFGVESSSYGDKLYIHDFGLHKDLNLLHQKRFITERRGGFHVVPPLLLSGEITGVAKKQDHPFGKDLDNNVAHFEASAKVDLTAFINKWTTGYIEMDADAFGVNRSFQVKQAFFTVGNLSHYPFYGTFGLQYVPFGSYITEMLTDTLPKQLARAKAPALTLGLDKQFTPHTEVDAALYVFDGDTQDSDERKINQWGADFTYHAHHLLLNRDSGFDVGVSYINNISSSSGMNAVIAGDIFDDGNDDASNDNPVFNNLGFVEHYVPGIDGHARIKKGPASLTAEYVTAMRHFSKMDFIQIHHGNREAIQPSAFHAELDYDFKLFHKENMLAFAYDTTTQALAFGLPQTQYGATYQISLLKNTKLSLEYVMKHDYDSDLSVQGEEFATGTGKRNEIFAAQVNVYF